MLTSARLTIKQYRFEVLAAALTAFVVGMAALIVTFRLSSIAMPPGCFEAWVGAPGGVFAPECAIATRLWQSISNNEANFVFVAMLILPFVVGLIGGIPIVARELEAGTAQTAWFLSPSRSRWLGRQLLPVFALGGFAVGFAAIAAAVLETTQPGVQVLHGTVQGPIVVSRALAAFGIAVLLGSVIGRSLPAFLIGMVLCGALAAVAEPARLGWLEDHKVVIGRWEDARFHGYSFGYAWRTPEGELIAPGDDDRIDIYDRVPPEVRQLPDEPDSGPGAWLREHGYEHLQMGVTEEIVRGWIPIEVAGMSLLGLGAIGAAAVAVNRRRPT